MRSINFLRFFFLASFLISIVILFLGGMGYILNLFFDMGPMFEIPYSGEAHLKINASYDLMGGESFIGEVNANIALNTLVLKTLPYRLFALINFSILITITVVSLRYLFNLFGNFGAAKEWADFFTRENYGFIKKLAVLLLIGTSYMFLRDIILSWVLLQDTMLFGKSIQFHPDGSNLSAFITVFVLFGASRVFKAAIEMKEDSELTI